LAADAARGLVAEPNVLLSLGQLADHLARLLPGATAPEGEVLESPLLDCFLLAAAMAQVVEDHLERDVAGLRRVADRLAPPGPARQALHRAAAASSRLRGRRPAERRLEAKAARLSLLVERLAEAVVAASSAGSPAGTAWCLGELADEDWRDWPPGLAGQVLRPPNCFHSFDQRPADCWRLASRVASRWPQPEVPLAVVGVRTSGSYLAPLVAASLRLLGRPPACSATMRPGRPPSARTARALASVSAAGGRVLVVDDPPRSGRALRRAFGDLAASGVDAGALVACVQALGGPGELADTLAGAEAVVLGWDQWSVHDQLSPEGLRLLLGRALAGREVVLRGRRLRVGAVKAARVEPEAQARLARGTRGHVTVPVQAELQPAAGGEPVLARLGVEGVGLGFLGRHALVAARRLAGWVPEPFGLAGGFLVREWLDDTGRLGQPVGWEEAGLMVDYVAARAQALALPRDPTWAMAGAGPVWEQLAAMLAEPFGRAAPLASPLARRAAGRLGRAAQPCVVDGAMEPDNFFRRPGGLAKVAFARASVTQKEVLCSDPVLDLAQVAAGPEAEPPGGRRAFVESRFGRPVPPEAFLLYGLWHACSAGSDELAAARPPLEYWSTWLEDAPAPEDGPLCALDLDGVVETRWMGVPSASPKSALALRMLCRHGLRPVLATGRSLAEARQRCHAYRLAGAVAEYGAVAYDPRSGQQLCLLSEAERRAMDEVRVLLAAHGGVEVSPHHRFCVRASERRRGLDPSVAEQVVWAMGGSVEAVAAQTQCDFVPARLGKERGLAGLAEMLGAGGQGLELAVGDTASDLGMLAMARVARAPAGAEAEVLARARPTRRPAQAGLLEAVAELVGHPGADCPRCRPPARAPQRALLEAFLGALGGDRRQKLEQAALAARLLSGAPGRRRLPELAP